MKVYPMKNIGMSRLQKIVLPLLCIALLIMFISLALSDTILPPIPAGQLRVQACCCPRVGILPVYSAPDEASVRGAKGKAKVDTTEPVQFFGRDGEWMMIQYQISSSSYRIGYIKDNGTLLENVETLPFLYESRTLLKSTNLTDDPLGKASTLCHLEGEEDVVLLSMLGSQWAYVEAVTTSGKVRGFVPSWVLEDDCSASLQQQSALCPQADAQGKWGYVDAEKHYVIQPQYDQADPFRGNYAVVTVISENTDKKNYCQGIIDMDGKWILDPVYLIDEGYDGGYYGGREHGILYLTDRSGAESWFYLDTGYFSGEDLRQYEGFTLDTYWKYNSVVAMIQNIDTDCFMLIRLDDGQPIACALFEQKWPQGTNTEVVNPSDVFFHDGFLCFILYDEETDEPQQAWSIDECGTSVKLDSNYIVNNTETSCGLIPAISKKTRLWGYLSMKTGKPVIKAQYLEAEPFSMNGESVVLTKSGERVTIDTNGKIVH